MKSQVQVLYLIYLSHYYSLPNLSCNGYYSRFYKINKSLSFVINERHTHGLELKKMHILHNRFNYSIALVTEFKKVIKLCFLALGPIIPINQLQKTYFNIILCFASLSMKDVGAPSAVSSVYCQEEHEVHRLPGGYPGGSCIIIACATSPGPFF